LCTSEKKCKKVCGGEEIMALDKNSAAIAVVVDFPKKAVQ
jgi:hypothetical protein